MEENMSVNSAVQFISEIKASADLQAKVSSVDNGMAGLLQVAAEQGYDLSKIDLRRGYFEHAQSNKPNFNADGLELNQLSITPDYLSVYMCADNTTDGCNDCNVDSD